MSRRAFTDSSPSIADERTETEVPEEVLNSAAQRQVCVPGRTPTTRRSPLAFSVMQQLGEGKRRPNRKKTRLIALCIATAALSIKYASNYIREALT